MITIPATFRDQADSNGITVAIMVIVTTVLVAASFSCNKFARLRRSLPPGPHGWPILGSLPYLGTLPHRDLRELSRKYGPVMFMHLGSVPTVVVSNADMAKQFLKANDLNMASRPELIIPKYIMYDSQDMFCSPYGDRWRTIRKIATLKLLTVTRINQYQDVRQRELMEVLQAIYNGCQSTKPVVPVHFISSMSTNVITQMMWGKRHCGIRAEKDLVPDQAFKFIVREVLTLMGAVNVGDYVPMLKFPTMKIMGYDRRMKAVRKTVDGFLDRIIEEHQHSETSIGNSDKLEDFVDVLLKHMHSPEAASESGEAFSMDSMKALLLDMILAGTDTTTATIEWALAELVKRPNLMAKLQDELKSVVGSDRLVTMADVPNLKYLQAVIKETLRMHPPGPLAGPHKSIHDCQIGGYHIPGQAVVIFNIFAIHSDPAVWERPQEFDPDRFLNSSIDVKGQDFELIPFGAGRRMCPALNLGLVTVSSSLANLLHAFDWSLPIDQMPEELDMMETFGLTTPKAIPLTVLAKPRLPHHVIFLDI